MLPAINLGFSGPVSMFCVLPCSNASRRTDVVDKMRASHKSVPVDVQQIDHTRIVLGLSGTAVELSYFPSGQAD